METFWKEHSRQHRNCKGPEAGACRACSKTYKEAGVARGQKEGKARVAGDEVTEEARWDVLSLGSYSRK